MEATDTRTCGRPTWDWAFRIEGSILAWTARRDRPYLPCFDDIADGGCRRNVTVRYSPSTRSNTGRSKVRVFSHTALKGFDAQLKTDDR